MDYPNNAAPILEAQIARYTPARSATPILRDIRLSIFPGELVTLAGESGAGKSVLLLCLAGAIPRYGGGQLEASIRIAGQNPQSTELPKLATLVGLVLEDPPCQLFASTVEQCVAFGPESLGLGSAEIRRRVIDSLEAVGILELANREVTSLSGGEARRATIAGALALDPLILLIDQATAGIDDDGTAGLYERLSHWCHERKRSALVVDDGRGLAGRWATRSITLAHGTLAFGTSAAAAPKRSSECVPLIRATQLALGRPVCSAVTLRSVSHRYSGAHPFSIDSVNLDLHEGELVSLEGPNGAGKTTLLRLISGLARPETGTITISGLDTSRAKPSTLARLMSFVPQNPDDQFCAESVREETAYSLRLRKMPAMTDRFVISSLDELGLIDVAERHPFTLSAGEKQRLALASALVTKPAVILADEPTACLDPVWADRVMAILAKRATMGACVLIASHDHRLVSRYASRRICLDHGRLSSGPLGFDNQVQTPLTSACTLAAEKF